MPSDLDSYRRGDPESKAKRSERRLRDALESQVGEEREPVCGKYDWPYQERGNGPAPRDRGNRAV